MSISFNKNTAAGFSLIELSIMITVFSVLMTGVLSRYTIEKESTSFTGTLDKLTQIDAALKYYLAHRKHLPCPASLTATKASSPTLFGRAPVNCATALPANSGLFDKFNIRIGMVPIRDLGLSDEYAYDDWGRRYTYVVVKNLAIDNIAFEAHNTTTITLPPGTTPFSVKTDETTNANFSVNNENKIYGDNLNTERVAYVLISHGKTGSGGFNTEGLEGTPSCNIPSWITWTERYKNADVENCDHSETSHTNTPNNKNLVFAHFALNEKPDIPTDFYDDYVKWESYENLYNNVIHRTPPPSSGTPDQ